jgi:hypothetical protein
MGKGKTLHGKKKRYKEKYFTRKTKKSTGERFVSGAFLIKNN